MRTARIAPYFGIVIRQGALAERNVTLAEVLKVFECEQPYDSTPDLLSFGPCFGMDAVDTLSERLKAAGLEYIDDYFVFSGDFPEWCGFEAKLINSG